MGDEDKPGFVDRMLANAMRDNEKSWDRCEICNKRLPPGSPSLKLYDDNIGSITACIDCSLKAVLWYVRNMQSGKLPSTTK